MPRRGRGELAVISSAVLISAFLSLCCGEGSGQRDTNHVTTFHRSRRSTSCSDKYQTIAGHTICLEKSSKASQSGVSSADQTNIVQYHNDYRAGVSPTAADMLKLKWDADVAAIAQKWADACEMKHDDNEQRSIPGRFNLGQNIAEGQSSWQEVVKAWYDEVSDFTLGQDNDLHTVGHYTQVVWSDTQTVGCGYAMCGTRSFYVCNYGPPGNVGSGSTVSQPYKQGTSCADCSGNCDNKLCDCSTLCLNGGTVNRNDCSCTCKSYNVYTGNNCQLDCSQSAKDPSTCDGSYGDNSCSAIAHDCPYKCVVCPYAGVGYVEGSVPVKHRASGDATQVQSDVILAVALVTVSLVI